MHTASKGRRTLKNGFNHYTFGFNGQENINELTGSTGTHLDFGARVYDSRIGRWTACDPLAAKYHSLSSYCFVGNMPIIAIDPDGKQIQVISNNPEYRNYILTVIQKLTSDELIMDENGIISISTKSINPSK
ncbi:MAG: hypothetical protein JXR58_02915 [Bacteroidales bacterium]|nr:hypothetical protein [Bacteroidales bacterium]